MGRSTIRACPRGATPSASWDLERPSADGDGISGDPIGRGVFDSKCQTVADSGRIRSHLAAVRREGPVEEHGFDAVVVMEILNVA